MNFIKRVLMTGATGFLGSHLARAMSKSSHELIIIKRRGSSTRRIASLLPGSTVYDSENLDLRVLFEKHGEIDAVIHTATCYGRGNEMTSDIFEVNTAFPLRLLDAAVLGRVGIFYNFDTVVSKHLNDYALSKSHFGEWGRTFAARKKIRFVNIRMEHIYGPCDSKRSFTTHVIESCLKNIPALDLTLGEQKRDFIYIDDVVNAVLKVWNATQSMKDYYLEYEVGTGNPLSIRTFVELVKKITRSATQLNFGAVPYRDNEMMDCTLNIKSLKALGWLPRVGLATGIKLVVHKIRSYSRRPRRSGVR